MQISVVVTRVVYLAFELGSSISLGQPSVTELHLILLLIKVFFVPQKEWMSDEKYASLLYENFVISVPMMLDICVVYGHSNPKEVRNLLDYIFTVQPFYKEDLQRMISNIKCVIDFKVAFLSINVNCIINVK